jgi:hypothetical protein
LNNENVYVNVTWMLLVIRLEILNNQNVYVNVTWMLLAIRLLEILNNENVHVIVTWMLLVMRLVFHCWGVIACDNKCYTIVIGSPYTAPILKISIKVVVYVNVTRVLRSRHVDNIEWEGNCLWECYTS